MQSSTEECSLFLYPGSIVMSNDCANCTSAAVLEQRFVSKPKHCMIDMFKVMFRSVN